MSQITDELLPCPFCGSNGDTFFKPTPNSPTGFRWSVVCNDKCLAEGPMENTEAEAIAAWNRRSTPPVGAETDEVVAWGNAETVGNLIAQLRTFDPATPVYGAFHADAGDGRKARVRGLTLSRERVSGRLIDTGNEAVPYSVVAWTAADEGPPRSDKANGDWVTEKLVAEAMLDAWNDICSDTGHHPLDIEQVGRGRLEFSPRHWAAFTAQRLLSTSHAVPNTVGEDKL